MHCGHLLMLCALSAFCEALSSVSPKHTLYDIPVSNNGVSLITKIQIRTRRRLWSISSFSGSMSNYCQQETTGRIRSLDRFSSRPWWISIRRIPQSQSPRKSAIPEDPRDWSLHCRVWYLCKYMRGQLNEYGVLVSPHIHTMLATFILFYAIIPQFFLPNIYFRLAICCQSMKISVLPFNQIIQFPIKLQDSMICTWQPFKCASTRLDLPLEVSTHDKMPWRSTPSSFMWLRIYFLRL